MTEHLLAIFLQPPFVRLLMHPVNRRHLLAHQPARHRLVGQQHEFLDQLMGNVVLHLLDALHPALFIQPDFHFGKIQVQRTRLEPQPPDPLGQRIRVMQHLLNPVARLPLQNRQHFPIGKSPL